MNETNLELPQKESVNLVHFVNRLVRAGTNKIGASKVDSDFYAFQKSALDAIIGKIDIAAPESVLVVDDAGLQIIQRLVNAGVKNITLAITRLDKDSLIDLSYIIKKRLTKYNWNINLDIRHFEEVMGMNFDLVIANPPYGKIGAEITKKTIDSIKFKNYINLLPANDYLKVTGLTDYVVDTFPLPGFGEDANVIPNLSRISSAKIRTLSEEEAYLFFSSDQVTRKYFQNNQQRAPVVSIIEDTTDASMTFEDKLIFGVKISANAKNHADGCLLQGSKKGIIYAINTKQKTLKDHYETRRSKALWGTILQFNSIKERENAFSFIYSNYGSQFMNMLATSMHKDNFHIREINYLFPKVDWTHPWTVEEILKDYGYTDSEIKEVMDDLPNFKGMDD